MSPPISRLSPWNSPEYSVLQRRKLDCGWNWNACDSQPVFIDRDMWEKIVLNLISNAFKFTFEGAIAVSMPKRGIPLNYACKIMEWASRRGALPAFRPLPSCREYAQPHSRRQRDRPGACAGTRQASRRKGPRGKPGGTGSTFIVAFRWAAHLPADKIGGIAPWPRPRSGPRHSSKRRSVGCRRARTSSTRRNFLR